MSSVMILGCDRKAGGGMGEGFGVRLEGSIPTYSISTSSSELIDSGTLGEQDWYAAEGLGTCCGEQPARVVVCLPDMVSLHVLRAG